MKEEFEYKIRKKPAHIIAFVIFVIVIIFFVMLIEAFDVLLFQPKIAGYILALAGGVALIISLFFFPMSINLTYRIVVEYLLVREKEIDFVDIEYYERDTASIIPITMTLKLKSGKSIIFFFDEEDWEYIQSYFENHNVKRKPIKEEGPIRIRISKEEAKKRTDLPKS